jgi:EAL domain-containing protein (putative c-di-GMP-specific phosphodiesterase class I)
MRADVDTIKLDRRFIGDLTVDVRAAAISSAVIFLGHSLGLRVVAEGVETEQHLEFLRAQDCDDAQGFMLGEPMTAEAFEEVLRKYARRVS